MLRFLLGFKNLTRSYPDRSVSSEAPPPLCHFRNDQGKIIITIKRRFVKYPYYHSISVIFTHPMLPVSIISSGINKTSALWRLSTALDIPISVIEKHCVFEYEEGTNE